MRRTRIGGYRIGNMRHKDDKRQLAAFRTIGARVVKEDAVSKFEGSVSSLLKTKREKAKTKRRAKAKAHAKSLN